MFAHQAAKYNRWFPQGDWLVDIGLTHLSSNSRMGYFLWLNERIDTINTAKVTANINASNTVTGTTPFRTGVSQPPLSYLSIILKLYHTYVLLYMLKVPPVSYLRRKQGQSLITSLLC